MPYRTRESDLVMPALTLIRDCADPEVGISTAQLRYQLRTMIQPYPADLEQLRNRNDDRLSQVLRNLVSHRTLERKGYATYYASPESGEGFYRITEKGREAIPPRDTPIVYK